MAALRPLRCLGLGALGVFLAGWLQLQADPLVEAAGSPERRALVAAAAAALSEEGWFLLALLLWAWPAGPGRAGRTPMLAGALLGLGFGLMEALAGGFALAGRLLAIPGHLASGVILGRFVGRAWPPGEGLRPGPLVAGLALTGALHGIWDLAVFQLEVPEVLVEARAMWALPILGVLLVQAGLVLGYCREKSERTRAASGSAGASEAGVAGPGASCGR